MDTMKKQLDIGCSGFTRQWEGYESWGIDIVPHPDQPHIIQADLALNDIPFPDNEFDLVTAYDFLEHLPMVIYTPQRRDVMISLFNEIYRVLKPDGKFYIQSPCYPDRSCFQDPQHLSVWTDESLNYFSGDYYGFKEHYGHTSSFVKVYQRIENGHLIAELEAKK